MKKKNNKFDFIFVGLALFAMFFGAGNLIFPPEIGVRSGWLWVIGFICFLLADAGLGVLGVIAVGKVDGDLNSITGTIGRKAGIILNTVVILCIGPAVAIPRTSTVSYGLGLAPVFGLPQGGMSLAIYSIAFFALVLALTIKPSKVVDVVGKILTPFLVLSLMVLIVVGVFAPAASVSEPAPGFDTAEVVKYSIYQGYQTMDGMASVFFGIVIILAIQANGFKSKGEITKQVLKSSVVAGVLLLAVYGGIAYLGASTGVIWKDELLNNSIDQAGLVSNIISRLMGYPGTIVLGIAVILACLTTAIGLTSAAADYFADFVEDEEKHEKVYKVVCIAVCVVSAFLSNLGLGQIISIAAPILTLVYPVIIFLLIASLFRKWLVKKSEYVAGALGTFVINLCSVMSAANGGLFGIKVEAFDFVKSLPLDSYGFNWLLPCILMVIIGHFLPSGKIDEVKSKVLS